MNREPLKLLIVDDEPELRRSVASILQSILPEVQIHVTEAENGMQAVQKAKSERFDMILMDVKMPELNGLEALHRIKEHDPRTFVVIMTAHSNLNDAVLAIKEGAYDYLEKPVKPDVLADIVRKSLQAREMVTNLALSNPCLLYTSP
ncbi:MAG: response regulator, partial [Bdellovibrionaceae bacterium]|nr:response regulator [Pseudobdellovibrionaceae bacterium]